MGQLSNVNLRVYEYCLTRKTSSKSFGKAIRVEFSLKLVHCDVWRPMNVRARHEASYFIIFITIWCLFNFTHLKHWIVLGVIFLTAENQLNVILKTLRIDRGHEWKVICQKVLLFGDTSSLDLYKCLYYQLYIYICVYVYNEIEVLRCVHVR